MQQATDNFLADGKARRSTRTAGDDRDAYARIRSIEQHQPVLRRGVGADPALEHRRWLDPQGRTELLEDERIDGLGAKGIGRGRVMVAVADDEAAEPASESTSEVSKDATRVG